VTPSILVLAKKPLAGRVKTRLCPPCSPAEAAAIAAAALEDTLAAVRAVPARRVLAVDAAYVARGFESLRQHGNGLAERIVNAIADVGAPVLQIGMDTPQVTPRLLIRCARELMRVDVDAVLGPCADGGWWLLGVTDPAMARAIRDVPMSTPETGILTRKALRQAGLRVRLLPTLIDVDVIDDARAVAALVPGGAFAAAVTGVERAA